MASNLSGQFKSVLDQFVPDVLGCFWVSDKGLARDLPGFDEFNYLFDGLLSQYISTSTAELPRANIFFAQNFDKKVFLSHIKNEGDISGHLDEQIAIIKNSHETRKKVLVFNQSSKDWLSELKKRYSQFDFQPLDF